MKRQLNKDFKEKVLNLIDSKITLLEGHILNLPINCEEYILAKAQQIIFLNLRDEIGDL